MVVVVLRRFRCAVSPFFRASLFLSLDFTIDNGTVDSILQQSANQQSAALSFVHPSFVLLASFYLTSLSTTIDSEARVCSRRLVW